MVTPKQHFNYLPDGSIDLDAWLDHIKQKYSISNADLLLQAAKLANTSSKGLTTFYGQSCIEQGLEMAEIILELKLDLTTVAAAILTSTAQHTSITPDEIQQKLDANVAGLIHNVLAMRVWSQLQKPSTKARDQIQIDRLRKAFLAMVADIRVVILKLAERTCIMRGIKNINSIERQRYAQETMDIYAPLANRLGIGQLKWELEDFAFHYLKPEAYKKIANYLAEKRTDREKRITHVITRLDQELKAANIHAKISGRAKHIYSIYLKMQRKDLDYQHIYDYSAIRLLVTNTDDCYTALSIVHQLYEHVPEEFDDYITHPKSNGYRSIHTAVIDPDGKHLEIQIRSQSMHEEAEHGVAAHWLYKENKLQLSGYEAKITFLRQLLAWHKEVTQQTKLNEQQAELLEDRVYAFTPAGEIIDLPLGATPLDFAYAIHSEVGHRCRGAKVKGHIVPLTYQLHTGDQIEIITTQQGAPSRDWLKKDAGYLTTSRARAKVMHWFKQQDVQQYIESGRQQLERELERAGINHPNLEKIAAHFNFKSDQALFAAIGHGSLKAAQVAHSLQTASTHDNSKTIHHVAADKNTPPPLASLKIAGINDLLTRIALCCKPIPGDAIIGFITQGRGVSIHRPDCNNMKPHLLHQPERLIQVTWDSNKLGNYHVDLQLIAVGKPDFLREIAALLANEKVTLIQLHTIPPKNDLVNIALTIQIQHIAQLKTITNHLQQLPNVLEVKRLSE